MQMQIVPPFTSGKNHSNYGNEINVSMKINITHVRDGNVTPIDRNLSLSSVVKRSGCETNNSNVTALSSCL